jgi:transcriptional regulator with XRE-family HTH domain
MSVGNRLRDRRAEVNMTQEQVATASGMHITQYNGYERGRSRPAPATLARIAAALTTTPEALLEQSNELATAYARAESDHSVRSLFGALRDAIAAQLDIQPDEVVIRIELPLQSISIVGDAGR